MKCLYPPATDVTTADDSPSIGDRLREFGGKVREVASHVGEKTKDVFNKIHHSEPATKTRNWITETFQKAKDALNIKSK
ncbi:hypothetical protein NDU88_011720 [Pleurodeles waltl]|uniref:Uncharacterized protein n=1 Tax=Pleurodeles waltl TaxID=8319 RepID=A0AAV7PZK5_PLEWA|nr:hypothetical protein NDU88_011720 [Pleurodeles waltl]